MSGGSLRRPMGFFAPFNTWWSSFFLQNGRRPHKTDIEIWRAGNPTWRPELTLEDIIQHSKGRRDPEKNRQYFVEYRRKKKDCEKRAAKQGRAIGRAAPKNFVADEPWEESTSVEKADLESTDEEAAQTSSPRCKQPFRCCRVKPQAQDPTPQACSSPAPITSGMDRSSADPDVVEATAAATAQAATAQAAQMGDSDAGTANSLNVVYAHDYNRDTSGDGPKAVPEAFSVAMSAPHIPLQSEADAPTRIPVRRTRGPMVATQLRSATAQMQKRGHGVVGVLCRRGDGSSGVLKSFCNLATAATTVATDASSWAAAGPEPVAAPSASWYAQSSNVALDYMHPGDAANSSGGDAPALPIHLETPRVGLSCVIPEPASAPSSMVSPPCVVAGKRSDSAAPSWMLMRPSLVEDGHLTAGAPPPGVGAASGLDAIATGINSLAVEWAADVASAAVALPTLPFCDHRLHGTCSTGSISTGMVAAASEIGIDGIPEGWTLPFELESPTLGIALVTGDDARDGPYGCVPREATCVVEESTLLRTKRQRIDAKSRTAGLPPQPTAHPCEPDIVTADLHAISMPLSFDAKHASASLDTEELYKLRCMAVAWTPGRSGDLFSGSSARQPVSAIAVGDERPCATSTSHWNITWVPYNNFDAESQPQPQRESNPQCKETEPEADLTDTSWLDRLIAGSQTDFLMEAPIAEALHGLSTGTCAAPSLLDLGGGGDELVWSTSI
ncbi:hypothetical protein Vafri_6970 [Volvox africanus]|uniref:Uncharacterized protein n=1 Tax=Volvox africanus TaxID=51714 RepID=A0A8J4AZI3_9CHLO|nr:hypothetical protein Vafri_6970 [Volvox africanus]